MNNISPGILIECPNCVKTGKRQILGRLLDDGQVLVLRFHHGTTLLNPSPNPIILKCGCEYGYTISGTVILQNIIPNMV